MAVITSTTTAVAQGLYISRKLVSLNAQYHRLEQYAGQEPLKEKMGKKIRFIKPSRIDVPVDKLTEAVTPNETDMSIGYQEATVDQWGLYVTLSDTVEVTTDLDVLNTGLKLIADAVARCQSYNLAEVLNANTNVQFWDGTRATRGDITTTDTVNKSVLIKIKADFGQNGVQPPGRGGGGAVIDPGTATGGMSGQVYAFVCDSSVEGDILAENASTGGFTFGTAHLNAGNDKLERGVIGTWIGFKIVTSNFLPLFTRLDISGWTVGASTGGSLSTGTTYRYKITRKSLARGFEEDISVETTQATGGSGTRISFTAPPTAGYVYNIYFGATTGDANLFLVRENMAPSATHNVDTVPSSGTNPPATPASGVTVHPCYAVGADAYDMVKLNQLSMMGVITPKGASDSDPLVQRRKAGSKWMQKGAVRNSRNVKRVELASNF